ncbi:hypothetical protein WR25_09974 isoform A [Diploscapter pachys]|uniref:GINS complex subunit 4 n=1 Tax=Diploscapter pachys TaxID=2018661 RepID=A0A2A2KQQ2_9BILA|nr:hypothetical protein WR25_09974 isoform A [Diploscapter pachys]
MDDSFQPDALLNAASSSGEAAEEIGNEEEDEELITPAEVLLKMKRAWQNEAAAPCILPHQYEILEILVDQIDGMDENLARVKDKTQLKVSIHRAELQRINYLTSDYMRIRLKKIEGNVRRIMTQHNERLRQGKPPLLSEQELRFAEKYAKAEAQLLGKSVLGFLPTPVQKIPHPEEDADLSSVYLQVLEDNVENVPLPDYTDPTAEVNHFRISFVIFNLLLNH